MSASKTILIDKEIDRDLLNILHEKVSDELESAQGALESARDEVEQLTAKLQRVEERMLGLTAETTIPPVLSKGGRVKKGVSKKLISDFLKASNGVGATLENIKTATATTISTARRVLLELEERGQAVHGDDSRWKWKTTEDSK